MTDTAGTNGYDGDALERFINEIEAQHDELDKLKSEHMLACKGPRGRIKETLQAVREADVNVVAFRVALKQRLDQRKHERRVEELEADDADAYEMIAHALGNLAETPLGQAALAKARPAKPKARRAKQHGDVLDSLKQ
jgi:hypothetical protein